MVHLVPVGHVGEAGGHVDPHQLLRLQAERGCLALLHCQFPSVKLGNHKKKNPEYFEESVLVHEKLLPLL